MPLNWMDLTRVSFNALLLMERVQLSWFPGWLPEKALGLALRANPAVAWFMSHKCPEIKDWVERVAVQGKDPALCTADEIRRAEVEVLAAMEDLVVYALDPDAYDAQPFLGWDSKELLDMLDFKGKTVVDVGSGTGRLALTVAPLAQAVLAVEPVANLRSFIKNKAHSLGLDNVFTVDGLITDIPFPPQFADVVLVGHVFGDALEEELLELERVTRPGGMIFLCPGNNDQDNDIHRFLLAHGFSWSRFEEPGDGMKRKYWKDV